jgi:hypothetical protein
VLSNTRGNIGWVTQVIGGGGGGRGERQRREGEGEGEKRGRAEKKYFEIICVEFFFCGSSVSRKLLFTQT